jgi:hypothetical protein
VAARLDAVRERDEDGADRALARASPGGCLRAYVRAAMERAGPPPSDDPCYGDLPAGVTRDMIYPGSAPHETDVIAREIMRTPLPNGWWRYGSAAVRYMKEYLIAVDWHSVRNRDYERIRQEERWPVSLLDLYNMSGCLEDVRSQLIARGVPIEGAHVMSRWFQTERLRRRAFSIRSVKAGKSPLKIIQCPYCVHSFMM